MHITKMEFHDIDKVVELYIELVDYLKNQTKDIYFEHNESTDDLFKHELEDHVINDNKMTYVAKDNDEIVAFISGEIKNNFLVISKIRKIGYISAAFVSAEYRKKEIMKKLEAEMMDFFIKKEVTFVELNILADNHLARDSWEGLGYKTFREHLRKKI